MNSMPMKLTMMAIFVVAVSIPNVSFAEDKSSGCGLGWAVTKKQGLLSSLTRAYTNYTFSSTFAMTSGTSGCAKHSLAKEETLDTYYAEANFHNLMVEMAQGRGEYVSAFATTLGCKNSQMDAFASTMKQHYGEIFTSEKTTPHEMLDRVKGHMKRNPTLASCEKVAS